MKWYLAFNRKCNYTLLLNTCFGYAKAFIGILFLFFEYLSWLFSFLHIFIFTYAYAFNTACSRMRMCVTLFEGFKWQVCREFRLPKCFFYLFLRWQNVGLLFSIPSPYNTRCVPAHSPCTRVYLVYLRVEKSRITLRGATNSAIHPIPHFAFLSYNKASDLSLWLITYTGPVRWSNLSFFIAIPLFIILLSAHAAITRRRGVISLPQFMRFHLIVSLLSRQIQD